MAVASNADGSRIYVAQGFFENVISVIDTATNTVVASVPFGTSSNLYPLGMAIRGNKLYVTSQEAAPDNLLFEFTI